MHVLTIDAEPEPFEVRPESTTVIVVDMQNDFGSPGGMFDRAGIDIEPIRQVVGPTSEVLEAARLAGIRVVYLKMGYHADLADLGAPGSPNRLLHDRLGVGQLVQVPDGREQRVLVRDEWGTDIVDALEPSADDTVIYKTRFSGFYDTELDDVLRAAGITHLIVVGCTTSVCVESTIRDAAYRDYQCLLLQDCAAEPIGADLDQSNHAASVRLIQLMFGSVSTSAHFVEAVGESGSKNSVQTRSSVDRRGKLERPVAVFQGGAPAFHGLAERVLDQP